MTLTLLADPILRPYLARLLPFSTHMIKTVFLSESPQMRQVQVARQLELAGESDAVVLLDGTDLIPEEGWQVGCVPLVMPHVHNLAALLLGGNDVYRSLFERYDGGVCWISPGQRQEWYITPREDCHLLCLLSDAQLDLPDASLYAQMVARYHNWDFIQMPSELSLLESLICGGWQASDFIVTTSAKTLFPLEFSRCI